MLRKELAQALKGIKVSRPVKLMEVCGTHTYQIRRYGIHKLLPEGVELRSGPGCPVCVTTDSYIDYALKLAEMGFTIATFGDMMKVPSKGRSLSTCKAEGGDIVTVYSPMDALKLAKENPEKRVVFLAVGFETTAPAIAATVKAAASQKLSNFFILPGNKTVPPVLKALTSDPQLQLNGFLLPGHVSTIIGEKAYSFLPQLGLPSVISGFEPEDIISSLILLIEMVEEGRKELVNNYKRAVRKEGNPVALSIMKDVFREDKACWRGLGWIEGSGLFPSEALSKFDIRKHVELPYEESSESSPLCRCGDVLAGRILPPECPAFGKACTPQRPFGPCMVSSEGSCAAYYRYGG